MLKRLWSGRSTETINPDDMVIISSDLDDGNVESTDSLLVDGSMDYLFDHQLEKPGYLDELSRRNKSLMTAQREVDKMVSLEDELNEMIATERAEEIKKIEEEIAAVAITNQMVATEVNRQGQTLDGIDLMITNSAEVVENGTAHLMYAEKRSNKWFGMVLGGIVAGGAIVGSVVYAIIAPGQKVVVSSGNSPTETTANNNN